MSDSSEAHAKLHAAKRSAREHARLSRARLTHVERVAASERIAETVCGLPELASAQIVLAYGASSEEVDVSQIVDALRARGLGVGFPRVEAPGVLGLHLVAQGEDLVPASFGIFEPRAQAPRIPRESVDAVIVPGVAFGPEGERLGYGGGFYDRLLPTLRPDCHRIGVCFDEQVFEALPTEQHDATVDVVVTPTRVLRRGTATSRRRAPQP